MFFVLLFKSTFCLSDVLTLLKLKSKEYFTLDCIVVLRNLNKYEDYGFLADCNFCSFSNTKK